MTKTEIYCDYCHASGAMTLSVVTGRSSDAAGSMNDETFDVDICAKCAIRTLQEYARLDKGALLGTGSAQVTPSAHP